MSYEEQLAEWANGNSIHDVACCPDFSCCQPLLAADLETRKLFVRSGEDVRTQMLYMFLGKAMALAGDKKIHIAGDPANHREVQ